MSALAIECANCRKVGGFTMQLIGVPTPDGWYDIKGPELHCEVCSISCLIEIGWKAEEQQTKLSKSALS